MFIGLPVLELDRKDEPDDPKSVLHLVQNKAPLKLSKLHFGQVCICFSPLLLQSEDTLALTRKHSYEFPNFFQLAHFKSSIEPDRL